MAGVVPWGTLPAPTDGVPTTGIYVVALTADPDAVGGATEAPPIDYAAVAELLDVRPELRMDGTRPTRDQLAARLAEFWFPDEVILYIGLAGQRKATPSGGQLANRVGEYFKTRLGARSPHAGGWPLKTLSCLTDLHVHYGYCGGVAKVEQRALRSFASGVSKATCAGLRDPVRVMPFANFECPKGTRKDHGITGARAPRGSETITSRRVKIAATAASPSSPIVTSAKPGTPTRHRSQNVTANDIAVGQVRIPIGATKRILPPVRTDIAVVLRGRELGDRRWDPRYGSDKERSGVLRVGKSAASELLIVGDLLAVSVDDVGAVSLD